MICKVCKVVEICDWCDDHERQVCTFCMDLEHRKLWEERVKVLQAADHVVDRFMPSLRKLAANAETPT